MTEDDAVLDVLLFTTENREHLLLKTVETLRKVLVATNHRLILCIDGIISEAAVSAVNPDFIVQARNRRGYIRSICDALLIVSSKSFFWVEDDWDLSRIRADDIKRASDLLEANPTWMQIRWSKVAPLEPEDVPIADGVNVSSVGFSANPCICRTKMIREAMDAVVASPPGRMLGADGFENVICERAEAEGVLNAVFDPGLIPAVTHLGYLESTGREWHMTSSLKAVPKGYGHLGERPKVWRRLFMLIKLSVAFSKIGLRQLFDHGYYDLAFRVIATVKGQR